MRSTKHVASAAAGIGIIAVGVAIWTGSAASARGFAPVPDTRQILNTYAKLPLAFVENRGQTDARVRYYAQGTRYAFYLTRDEVVLSFLNEPETRRARAGAAVPRQQPAARRSRAKSAHPARSTTSAATIPQRWRPASRATRRSRIASCGPAWTCGCASRPGR